MKEAKMEFILVPGAWAGAWLWDDVALHLKYKGHNIHQLSLSGLTGESNAKAIGLDDHVKEVETYILQNNLNKVVLVGHSYSGIVVGQVTSRNNVKVHHTIFVEAFLPVTGQSLLDVSGLSVNEEISSITDNKGFWPAPSFEELSRQLNLTQQQINLLVSKQMPQPGSTVTDLAELKRPLTEISATFIAHDNWLSGSRETKLIEELQKCKNWQFKTINGGHWPMLTLPQALAEHIHSSVL